MMNLKKLISTFAVIIVCLPAAFSQFLSDDDFKKTVVVENPVYYPVIGVGIGYFNFYGNVQDYYRSHTIGQPGYRINVAQYLSKIKSKQIVRLNFVFMTGSLSGTQRNVNDTSFLQNLNFKSNITSFGLNIHYSFKPLIEGKYFEPFISLGIQTLQFDTKGDYYYDSKNALRYHYWTDGTIRDAPQDGNHPDANIIPRRYDYSTDLRTKGIDKGKGYKPYSQFSFTIPIDIGVDFNISNRVTLRAATSFHYALTDFIDDKSSKNENPAYQGKAFNAFTFTYLSLHADIFSSGETKIIDTYAIDLDLDMALYDDEDDDGVLDIADLCPGTPPNAPVDSVGCPIDSDDDGIPDYMDREPNSRPGAIVDEYGVEITEEAFLEKINSMQAIRRNEVEAFLMMQKLLNRKPVGGLPIPSKFKKVDINNDGYISFDELMKAMNDFFDGISTYAPNDLEEMQRFFFEQ